MSSPKKGGVFLLALELKNIVKSFQGKAILKIQDLKIYAGEKIGLVGVNGCGKTTLLNIMAGVLPPDEGKVVRHTSIAHIVQLAGRSDRPSAISGVLAKEFRLGSNFYYSGGEETRCKIARALSGDSGILLADEPTANLDMKGIALLEEKLSAYQGAVILVSHDRELLDKLCTKILELKEGSLRVYQGNFSDYIRQKAAHQARQQFEYEQYIAEKNRLTAALLDKQQKSAVVRKAPSRMGNSEARLHKMGDQKAKASLDRSAKAVAARLERLAVKERPQDDNKARLSFGARDAVYSKLLIAADGLIKQFSGKKLFDDARFQIMKGQKTALIGDNGTGKTTLLQMILAKDAQITLASKLKIGYFSQDMSILAKEQTILQNALASSVYDENFVRLTLARLLFQGSDIYKKVALLSGGERVRVCFAKLMLSDNNMLILDEPTNYLDMYSLKAVEDVLKDYEGELLFVSHDRRFVSALANHLLIVQDGKITAYSGSFAQYLKEQAQTGTPLKNDRLVLERRLSEIISRLSAPGKNDDVLQLDAEYREVLASLKSLEI
jgi:macrolide transport system ATP-binding/permease protein